MLLERYELVLQRIKEVAKETAITESFGAYFRENATFLLLIENTRAIVNERKYFQSKTMEELKQQNEALYMAQMRSSYQTSYLNPDYAVNTLGSELGQYLCFLATELQGMIPYAFENNLSELLIRMELFAEVYTEFLYAYEETQMPPLKESIHDILYWFISDYSEPEYEKRVADQLCPSNSFASYIIADCDLTNLNYLYQYGEYVTENEIETARFINTLSEEQIEQISETFTEGFRKGFELAGKDLSKKKTVNIRYRLGFERIIKQSFEDFERLGLTPVLYRSGVTIFDRSRHGRIGFYGAVCNQQYEYDHREDDALFLDGHLITRKLECLKEAYKGQKEQAALLAGPAVMEVFGEEPFNPASSREACAYSEEQRKLIMEFTAESGKIINEYIKREERSFTIIAFPSYAIGKDFAGIFADTVLINTLDYRLYADMQQKLIDALNQGKSVRVIGGNGNETDITVSLYELTNSQKQTIFENCVADVNIPVGEVFTSPVLKGTNGTLHVSRVFLNELEYRNLKLVFKDGMVKDYSCSNFNSDEENRKFIRENLLHHYESLPLGEFAIGTNTVAYMMAKKYQIEDKLPILIAEKMGPHFAVGDTCYSEEEDVKVYNPDGKEIVAKENEVSALRKTDPKAAYFRCHTDITIPYHELAKVDVITEQNTTIELIRDGRFALSGCEKLNEPFD